MPKKKSFLMYSDQIKYIERLSNEEAGQVLKAVMQYANGVKSAPLSSEAELVFMFITMQIERDTEKWEEVSRKRSEAGKKSAQIRASKRRNSTNVNFVPTNSTDTVNDTVTETETETGTETETVQAAPAKPDGNEKAKRKYGNNKNIKLGDDEYKDLCRKYGEYTVKKYIDRMDDWMQKKRRDPYKDHAAELEKWMQKDGNLPDNCERIKKYEQFINVF